MRIPTSASRVALALALCAPLAALQGVTATPASAATSTTAWSAGAFSVDTPDLVREADVVLDGANTTAAQSMPLGNGTLGAAVWAADGFTAQLNRADTLPDRKSPGWLEIPGLSAITSAADFHGVLDPYDGVLTETGGGMTATIYVRADKDELVVDVTGASPTSTQTATVNLWSGRTPTAAATGQIATLAETWVDDTPTTGSGKTFGSLAALTAGGQNVTASVVDSETVKVTFNPNADGSFRVVVGAPQWTGGNAATTAAALLGTDATASSSSIEAAHLAWWQNYWAHLGLVKLSSADGTANYLEKLRTLYYYAEAAESRGSLPGSQAGLADLFNFDQDHQDWYPAGYWFWNLRGQIAANLGAGQSALNAPVFNLYTSNLANIEAWTKTYMGGRPGICVPETMRFNGNGFQDDSAPFSDPSCDQSVTTWNGETVSTGAEIGLWVWQEYLETGSTSFLQTNYPLMEQASEFLLSYTTVGSDGLRHAIANAHENQWDVQDPVNMIDAMKALFPATVSAAQVLGTDASLVTQLKTAETQIPDYPRTDGATHQQLLTASSDASGTDVLGQSSQPTATVHNSENDDLEAVWPYNLIGDTSSLFTLAQRTYTDRVNVDKEDWSFDAVDAARLDLPSEVAADMTAITETYQKYVDGMADWGTGDEPYIEQSANVALAVNESLVQDDDGILRIAPALPSGWDADGTQYIQGDDTVSVQVHGGVIGTVGINAGSTGSITMRNPWPGKSVEVVDGGNETTVIVSPTTASQFSIPTTSGHSYLVQQVAAPVSGMTYAELTGTPATAASHLGNVQIGLDGPTGEITGYGGLCVDDSGASTTNGSAVIVYTCSGSANQQWTVEPGGTLETLGKCMDITGGGTADGTKIELWTCDGGANQVWQAQSNGELLNPQSGKCLDDAGAGGSGTQLILYQCSDAANQQWKLP